MVVTLTVSLLLLARLGQLTVVEGVYQRKRADANRIVAVRSAAPRGIFFDTNGEAMVRNVPSYKRQIPGTAVAEAQFEELTREEAVKLSQQSGERIFFDIKREYLCGRACAVLLGYLGEVNREELQKVEGDYMIGDLLGKSGLERWYERELRGQPGSELVEVDARGMLVREIGKVEQVAGVDMNTTIDMGLQKVLYGALDGRPGAAIAQVPQTGEVLAFVSSPSYDPNNVAQSLLEEQQPFFNRVVGGAYAPGSVYKIVTAIAALEEEKITAETAFEDTGEINIGEFRFGNWFYLEHGRTEGAVDVVKALQRSNDIFFYKAGELVGANSLFEWSEMFGYNQTSGLDPLGEVAGLIPNEEWKEKTKGERWYLGNTYHMSIGQGDVTVTPLQVNRMMAAVANNGVLCDPLFLKYEVGKKSCTQLNLDEKTVELITEGLKRACEPGGTGVPFFRFERRMACKTGTAQQGGDTEHPHAWFTVFGPVETPEIALTVLVEKGGQGSEVAAPIAFEGIKYWFQKK